MYYTQQGHQWENFSMVRKTSMNGSRSRQLKQLPPLHSVLENQGKTQSQYREVACNDDLPVTILDQVATSWEQPTAGTLAKSTKISSKIYTFYPYLLPIKTHFCHTNKKKMLIWVIFHLFRIS